MWQNSLKPASLFSSGENVRGSSNLHAIAAVLLQNEFCPKCKKARRYQSHGWTDAAYDFSYFF
jgi:hypothetical protein